MKQYKVEITKEALQDMEDKYNYIAIDLLAPDNAMGQYNRIAVEILTLDTFPERFRIMDSEPEKRMELPFEEKTVILYKKKKQALSINSNIR